MAEPKKALYSTCVACLGFLCLVLSATAVGLPMWGYFDSALHAGASGEKGYFGPWKTCKQLLYSRERCGPHDSRFKSSIVVYMAGWAAVASTVVLGIFCILSVLQIAMINSKDKVVVSYSFAVMAKLALSLLATLLSVTAAILFALQTDDPENNGFQIKRGEAFYIQIVCIALDCFLFIMALYDVIFTRRPGGDPTHTITASDDGVTYGNPGYRDRAGGGISMTDASGKPYVNQQRGAATAAANGSLASVDTAMTITSSNGSSSVQDGSVTRSPLRSSLKKPRPKQEGGLGIQNPGFSGTSPTLSRNGSTKKVRIQTHSTEV